MIENLPALIIRSLRDPRSVIPEVAGGSWPMPTLWLGLAFVSVVGALVQLLPQVLVAGPSAASVFGLGPFALCVLLGAGTLGLSWMVTQTGRMLGGTGPFPSLFAVLIWFQLIGIVLQVAVVLIMVALPFLGAMLAIAANFYLIYVLIVFVDEAHELKSFGVSSAVVIGSFLALAIGMAVVAALFGVQPTVEIGNV